MINDIVSIVIPIYKVEKYLSKCVDSVLNQTYKYLEIILVDDGSPDLCPSICDEYKIKDNRIKVIHKKNGGLSDARNVGAENATGKYLVFIDSDDYVDARTIEIAVKAINEKKVDMVIWGVKYVDESGNDLQIVRGTIPKDEVWDSKNFWEYYFRRDKSVFCVVAWNKLYNRELFREISFPVGRVHEDEHIIYKVISRTNSVYAIHDQLTYYVQRDGSIMKNPSLNSFIDSYDAAKQLTNYFLENQIEFFYDSVKVMIDKASDLPEIEDRNNQLLSEMICEIRKLVKHGKQQNIRKSNNWNIVLFFYAPNLYIYLKRIKRKVLWENI